LPPPPPPPPPPNSPLQKKDNWSPKKMPEVLIQTNLQVIQDEWMTGQIDGWMMRQMDEMMLHDILYYM